MGPCPDLDYLIDYKEELIVGRGQSASIAETIFASTHLPLRLWFRAIYHLTRTKQGISSIELGRRPGVTQTTAWKVKRKLKRVMRSAG